MSDDRDERPDPALEPLAVTLRDSLSRRGIPADAIDETVMLALAYLHHWVARMQSNTNERLERLEAMVNRDPPVRPGPLASDPPDRGPFGYR